MAVSPAVYKLSFDVVKDLTPVGMVAKFPYVLVVPSTLPIRNVKELVAYARANPGKFNFASGSGTGSTTHLCPELLNASQGLTMAHIPYKGGAQAMIDLIAGQVQLFCGGITGTLSGMKSGKLRVIGIATTRRSEQLPDVATVIEQGIPGQSAGRGDVVRRACPPVVVVSCSELEWPLLCVDRLRVPPHAADPSTPPRREHGAAAASVPTGTTGAAGACGAAGAW
jgi:tripartite-type tricarboxylate transporter receptor subunit TctC